MNKIYKVIWKTLLGIWVVVSELAKGKTKAVRSLRRDVRESANVHISVARLRPKTLALCISLAGTGLLITPSVFAQIWEVGDQTALANAVKNAADGDTIKLTNDITITTNITVANLNKNVVIDGQGQYGLTGTATASYGFTINGERGDFTLKI